MSKNTRIYHLDLWVTYTIVLLHYLKHDVHKIQLVVTLSIQADNSNMIMFGAAVAVLFLSQNQFQLLYRSLYNTYIVKTACRKVPR